LLAQQLKKKRKLSNSAAIITLACLPACLSSKQECFAASSFVTNS